jgi:hypothetical protein
MTRYCTVYDIINYVNTEYRRTSIEWYHNMIWRINSSLSYMNNILLKEFVIPCDMKNKLIISHFHIEHYKVTYISDICDNDSDTNIYAIGNETKLYMKVLAFAGDKHITLLNKNNDPDIESIEIICGTYIDKNGIPMYVYVRFDADKNKFHIRGTFEKLIIDISDVYFGVTCNNETKIISYVSLTGETSIYNCSNINKKVYLKYHETLDYIHYERLLKQKKKDFFNTFDSYENILDEYTLITKYGSLKIKPMIFVHLIDADNSILGWKKYKKIDSKENEFTIDISLRALKHFFIWIYKNKLPKLYELIEDDIIQYIDELYTLCDYFNIQVYRLYLYDICELNIQNMFDN